MYCQYTNNAYYYTSNQISTFFIEATLPPLPPAFKESDDQPTKMQAQVDRFASVVEHPNSGPSTTYANEPSDNTEMDCIPESEPELEDDHQLSGLLECRDADISSSEAEDNNKRNMKKKKKLMASVDKLTPKGKCSTLSYAASHSSPKPSLHTPLKTPLQKTPKAKGKCSTVMNRV